MFTPKVKATFLKVLKDNYLGKTDVELRELKERFNIFVKDGRPDNSE